jgi:F-type H+-transporting ATPase subunit b
MLSFLPSFLHPDATVLVLWVIFMVVLFVLNQCVFQPTLKLVDARKSTTTGRKDETLHLIGKNQENLAVFERKMTQARLHAAHARENILNQARTEEAQIIAKARKENDGVLDELRGELAQERDEALMALKQHAQILARQMVDKVLERKVA